MSDPIMDAGAWRREALGLRERVRELEEAAAYHESQSRLSDAVADRRAAETDHARFMAAGWRRLAAELRREVEDWALEEAMASETAMLASARADRGDAELADLRAEREALYAVAQAARALLYTRHSPPGAWYDLHDALDALPCWCGKPDGHASGCPGGER